MGFIDQITDLVGGDDQTYRYRCSNCGATWQSQTADMSEVSCSECGSSAGIYSDPE